MRKKSAKGGAGGMGFARHPNRHWKKWIDSRGGAGKIDPVATSRGTELRPREREPFGLSLLFWSAARCLPALGPSFAPGREPFKAT